jgi:mannose-6-phosphate isomerase-like protein (cupin superfamily)
MTEPVAEAASSTSAAPPLPGGVGLTRLRVYESKAPDGLHGGSPHVHLSCTEAYFVVAGTGAVQTLSRGGFAEIPLAPGSLLWFTPGVVHRLVNRGRLEIVIVMQVATLPEAGDCLLSFPDDVLADEASYRAAAAHDPRGSVGAPDEEAARRRRDLAVTGFNALRERVEAGDLEALDHFYERAAALAMPLADLWRTSWREGPDRAAAEADRSIAALEEGRVPELAGAIFSIAPREREVLGVCGRLHPYPHPDGMRVGS